MPNPAQIQVHSLTRTYNGIARSITSPIEVYNTTTGVKENTEGIWDTGATGSTITQYLANKLNLIEIGQTRVKGVHGYKDGVKVYAVKIVLNNQNVSFIVPVTECSELTDDNSAHILIGMDVISKGDFAVTNFQGNTVMTFRVPSIQRIDFVAATVAHKPIISEQIPGRNDPCPCGNGKKYKHCHGKK